MKKKTTKIFIEEAQKVHGLFFDYTRVVYVNNVVHVCIICPNHGDFWQNPYSHLNGSGCKKCYFESIIVGPRESLGNVGFIKRSKLLFGDKYNYSLLDYKRNDVNICLICKLHDETFYQLPTSHFTGNEGCKKCRHDRKILLRKIKSPNGLRKFINEASALYGYKYDYSLVEYVNTQTKINIICNICKFVFAKTPARHINAKQGCPKCSKKARDENLLYSTSEFIEAAKLIHKDRYNYSGVIYVGSHKKIKIFCNQHSIWFEQTPTNHLSGKGCYKCFHNSSRIESDWLDSLNNKNIKKQKVFRINGSLYKVDGYDMDTDTVYEFFGDYWHGNPDVYNFADINQNTKLSFGQLYKRTVDKVYALKQHFHNVIIMWENDWNNRGETK